MGWIILLFAAIMEVVGVMGLKLFSMKKSSLNLLIFVGGFTASYILLYLSLEYLNMSIAYSVWAGTGTAGAVILSMILFNETKSFIRILSVTLVIIGVVGLKLTT